MRTQSVLSLIGASTLAGSLLFVSGLSSFIQPAVEAASSSVTLTYPADNLQTLDPIDWSGQLLVDQGTIFEGLFGYNPKNQIVPKIASSWKVTDGGRVWTISLRKNARWSNGQPVTANDFYYAWMRLLAPSDSTGAIWAGIASDLENGYAYHAGGVPASAVGLKVINPYELQLTLSGAMNIEGTLALAASMPLYPPSIEAHPSTWWQPQYFVGDGPYVVYSFVPNGKLVLTRNAKYVGHFGEINEGNVAQINLIPGPSVPVEDYQSGVLDAAILTSPSDYAYALAHLKGQVHKANQADVNYLQWDHSVDASPLNNQNVREAIAMAINRNPIVSPVLNNMVEATSVFAYPGFPTYKLEHNPYPYNLSRARQMLSRAGYPNAKGMPTLYLYTQTTSASPQSVAMGEAISAELKANLNLTVKIEPTNGTQYGELTSGGISANILPGYVIGYGAANWNSPNEWPLGTYQMVQLGYSGTIGSQAFRSHAAAWYLNAYDPRNVALWGSPTDNSLGVSFASWSPLIASAKKDIAYLNAFNAKQSATYRATLQPAGSVPLAQQLTNYEAAWKTAKTGAAKHAAWVALWKWVGTYSTGNAGMSLGLNGQVYVDQNEPALEAKMRMWEAELNDTASSAKAAQLSADMANAMIQSGYEVPLNVAQTVYLEKPDLTGVQPNPWSWSNFYQFQYLHLK